MIYCSPENSTLACAAETPKALAFWNTRKEPNVGNCHISRSIGGRLFRQKKVEGRSQFFFIFSTTSFPSFRNTDFKKAYVQWSSYLMFLYCFWLG